MNKDCVRFLIFTLILSLCTCSVVATNAEVGNAAFDVPIPWNGHALCVSYAVNNEKVKSGYAASGEKCVQVFLTSIDDTLSWDEVTSCGADLFMLGNDGTEYSVVTCGFQAEEGSSSNIADLAKNRHVGFSPIFDVPESSGFGTLNLVVKNGANGEVTNVSLADVPSKAPVAAKAIPEELVGAWSGTGKSVGGGSDISLEINVNSDGTGGYKFVQAGYVENYPFILESNSERFSVTIPSDNQLGITACEGTYVYYGGVLTLHITTTFSSSRKFEYVAECLKASVNNLSTDQEDAPAQDQSTSKDEAGSISKQAIVENIVAFLNAESPHTDDEIKSRLIMLPYEMTTDLGLIHTRNVQGELLGYVSRDDGNLLLFLGVKDVKKSRMITPVRIPIYAIDDDSSPLQFSLTGSKDRNLGNGGGSGTIAAMTKDSADILRVLDFNVNKNVMVTMSTDKITKDDLKRAAKYNSKTETKYVNELKEGIYFSRSLDAMVYRNGIEKLEYKDPKRKLWLLTTDTTLDDAVPFVDEVAVGDITNVPFIHSVFYLIR